ncbi:hypothetical protein SDC9_196441 [bioreactor metagenome]|uniref:PASTA domain-containing protein n=1 Tax=bioreactor metagenome TaxID=1076179 RepID=A0A645IEF1_9ZZZZ
MKVGLELGNISYDFSDNVGKDTIISQSIAPNAKVPYGQLVNIVISKGSEAQIKVPSLIGLSLSEATNILSELGLIVGNIGYKPDATYLPDVITDQSPQPGLIAAPGDAVNITITK